MPFLERYYETIILPLYQDAGITVLVWKEHGQLGPDSYAHYFEGLDGTEYVLMNDADPSDISFTDDESQDLIPYESGEHGSLRVEVGDAWIPNMTGYFSLYRERTPHADYLETQ